MVARDPLNQGSAPVNPLVCETPEEKEIFHAGEVNKLQRRMIDAESLFKIPPNESGIIHVKIENTWFNESWYCTLFLSFTDSLYEL